MNLPRRRKRERSGIRDGDGPIRCPAHLQWCRNFHCLIEGKSYAMGEYGYNHECDGRIEAHHVRKGADGGMGLKPSDATVVPLCTWAHSLVHSVGVDSFEKRYGVDLSATAAELWSRSPAGIKYRKGHP